MKPAEDLLWERWDEVDRLLEGALDLPADQRASHVAHAAASDDALRDLVMRLIDRLDASSERLTGPPDRLVLDAFSFDPGSESATDVEPGTQVGAYVITGRRGRGGMATVYEAARSDGAYEQKVALKVLRRGLDTDDLIRRFRTERQILSSLSHPHIARLLDGGSLPDGRPYLVMELVDGQPITAYADEARLDIRGRLDLFLAVADAVQAAHRQLVVHRDIKPSNILVDLDGQVKLLDFGIAKLLEADDEHTEAGYRALTPDYASPEQLEGKPITTSTDVYQLGLLLRELLTGLPKASGGDLGIIVGKALRTNPEDRYGSAEELAADVRRFLLGHPILAHPESVGYRMRKFVGRHPLFLPGAATAVVAIVGFITVLTLQNRRITRERDAAEIASRRALATQEFLVEILRSPDPTTSTQQSGGRDITVVDAMQRGRARVANELKDQPEVKAALLEAMGRTFSGLGRFETADTLLFQSARMQEQLYGSTDPRITHVLRARANNFRADRNFAAADSLLHVELGIRRSAGQSDTTLAGLLSVLSATRRDLGDVDSAVALAAQAVNVQRSIGDTTSKTFTSVLGNLAYVLRGSNRLDSAEGVYREVLRRQEQMSERNPMDIALTHNNLGFLLRTRGELAEAEKAYREAYRLTGEVLGDGHPTTLMIGSNLASVYELQGKLDDVVTLGRARIAAAQRQWPQGHWRVGSAHQALGRFLLRHNRAPEAVELLEAGVRSYTETLGVAHAWTASAQVDLGAALLVSGRVARGGELLERAHVVLVGKPGELDADIRLNLDRTAGILEKHGHGARARPYRELMATLKN